MRVQHPYRPTIPPVADGEPRPLWSVIIPIYNSASYLRETLASVLAQEPSPDVMQIAVVDDHSTQDDAAAVVEELGRGRVGAAFCRHIIIDEHSHWQHISELEQQESGVLPSSWLDLIAGFQRIQTPSIIVRREVYEKLGGFDYRLATNAEDWEMWLRIAANYPIWYEVEPLAMYRQHSGSRTKTNVKNGKYVQKLREAVKIFPGHLPKEKADQLYKTALRNCAFNALGIADSILAEGDMCSTLNRIL
jgi:GT2 family glycosyltransferase